MVIRISEPPSRFASTASSANFLVFGKYVSNKWRELEYKVLCVWYLLLNMQVAVVHTKNIRYSVSISLVPGMYEGSKMSVINSMSNPKKHLSIKTRLKVIY